MKTSTCPHEFARVWYARASGIRDARILAYLLGNYADAVRDETLRVERLRVQARLAALVAPS